MTAVFSSKPVGSPHSKAAGVLRALQLTDTHLYGSETGALVGIRTDHSLSEVIKLARQQVWPVDIVLATGDLVHDATIAGYERFIRHMRGLEAPVYTLPGNHDEGAMLREQLAQGPILATTSAVMGGWKFIFLDSTVQDEDYGHMAETQLAILQAELSADPDKHTLVCLHHQPVPVGASWLDGMKLDNAEAFFAILDRAPQVRGVLWGHVHQAFDSVRNGVKLMATPSTCVQFKPRSDAFAVDAVPPGYRWLDFYPDGRIETGVERLAAMPTTVDLKSLGYK